MMDESNNDFRFMNEAITLAKKAEALGEVPVGAIVVCNGQIVGRGYNRREIDFDPLAHAELIAVKQASQHLNSWRLLDCTLYVTAEPCPMCAGALVNARVKRLVFGCKDPKAGAVDSLFHICNDVRLNHRLVITAGVEEEVCANLLKVFFKDLRKYRIIV
jgi:tRNA(adenine34) deaminase